MSGRDELSGSPEPNDRQQMNRVGFDQNSLRSSSISEVFYEEDEVENLPPASDVSNHTMSEVERKFNECSSSLQWNKERVRELEIKLTLLEQEACSSKDAAATLEEQLSAALTSEAEIGAKYEEAVRALNLEQSKNNRSEAILEAVLRELEEKAVPFVLGERAEHERMAEAYRMINQELEDSLSERSNLEKIIQELQAALRRHERDYNLAQKEIVDLEKQVTILLKECRDIQLLCGSGGFDSPDDGTTAVGMNAESDTEGVIQERLLTFKDINGLVEQNVQLRSLVRNLSDQVESNDMEFKEKLEMELKKYTDEMDSKVAAVLQSAEEQGQMIAPLHASVAMYKRLYEEEHKLPSSLAPSAAALVERTDLKLLLERAQASSRKAPDQAMERARCLEEELAKSRSEIISLRSERDKLSLEANFSKERLNSFKKIFEYQRKEANGIIARNVEFSQLVVDYQRKLHESTEALHAAEGLSRKLTTEVSVITHEKEILLNAKKRACDEVHSLSERLHKLQGEWGDAKKQLQEEQDNALTLTLDREQTIENAMRQVGEMGKELANALRAVSAAESRAAVAEVKLSDLERKIESSDAMDVEMDAGSELPSFSNDEVIAELQLAKEKIEMLKVEAEASRDHMQQYKWIAEVNEYAFKQMGCTHKTLKIETDKLKQSMECQLLSLRSLVSKLEKELSLKSEELASATVEKEEALTSGLAERRNLNEEIRNLKEEISDKNSQLSAAKDQISTLKEELDKENRRQRALIDLLGRNL